MIASSALRILVPAFLLPLTMGHAGGWAVITVEDLPDVAEAGTPVVMTYTVRQHGVTLLAGLEGRVEAATARESARGSIRPAAQTGRYVASMTFPSAGEWSITIRSGFGNSNLTLMPLTVVAAGGSLTRPMTDASRGKQLFVSKGCVTCHAQIDVGPKLEGRRFDATDLSSFLANPRPPQAGKPAMPNLGLQQKEIASLVDYLNTDH